MTLCVLLWHYFNTKDPFFKSKCISSPDFNFILTSTLTLYWKFESQKILYMFYHVEILKIASLMKNIDLIYHSDDLSGNFLRVMVIKLAIFRNMNLCRQVANKMVFCKLCFLLERQFQISALEFYRLMSSNAFILH